MTFEAAMARYGAVIDCEVAAFRRTSRNWRLEKEDLRQEVLLKLWERWDEWQRAQDMRAFCKAVVRNHLRDYERHASTDALYHAEPRGLCVPQVRP